MQIATTPGDTYAVTTAAPCTVHALRGKEEPVLILTIEQPGQYIIVAPTCALEISDGSALVTKSFKSAPAGTAAHPATGGGSIGTETTDAPIAPDGPLDNLNTCGFTFRAAQAGALQAVTLTGRNGYEFHKNPVWLKIWKNTQTGPSWLGLSQNHTVQLNDRDNLWTFAPGVSIAAGDLITITSHREANKDSRNYAVEDEQSKLLCRVTPIPHQDGIGCLDDYGSPGWDFLPVGHLTLSRAASLSDYTQVSLMDETSFDPARTRPQTLYILQSKSK